MIFSLVFMFMIMGIMLSGVSLFLPENLFLLKIPLFFMGVVMEFIGIIILYGRATKTGAIHFLEFAKPESIIWIYVHTDGTVKITQAIREVEKQLYCEELDAQIQDFKSYRLFDHSIRFVPEGIGHAVDLDFVLYAMMLKRKHGFYTMTEAREGFMKLFKAKKPISCELIDDYKGTIEITEDMHKELLRIKNKNKSINFNDTIKGIVGLLKDFQKEEKEGDETG